MTARIQPLDTAALLPRVSTIVAAVDTGDLPRMRRVVNNCTLAEVNAILVMLAGYVDQERLQVDLDLARSGEPDPPIVEACLQAADRFNTTVLAIRSVSRRRNITEARQVACYAARLSGMTYPAIGAYLNRDHTTVIHSCGAVGERPRLRAIALDVARSVGWDRELVEEAS